MSEKEEEDLGTKYYMKENKKRFPLNQRLLGLGNCMVAFCRAVSVNAIKEKSHFLWRASLLLCDKTVQDGVYFYKL